MSIVTHAPPATRTWPSIRACLARPDGIPVHSTVPAWAAPRLHLAAWVLDMYDGTLPADAPAEWRDACVDLAVLLASERPAAWSAEDRDEWAWLVSAERAEYLESRERAEHAHFGGGW